jgi:ubiquinone/menaquinone biosynthesis C-methylase UbiE
VDAQRSLKLQDEARSPVAEEPLRCVNGDDLRGGTPNGRRASILFTVQPDQEVFNRWTGSAPFWEKHGAIIGQMFAPINQALVEEAGIGRGHTVLDIATGPGEPALSVAAVVGSEGKVVGIDPIPEMVAGARRAADRRGLTNVHFDVAFADHLPFPAETFDAVISRFGVMFFPTPVDGIREMLRVLKPGRRMALAVWHFADRNPFHYTLSRIMDRYVEPTPVAPDAPDAFRFATQGKLAEVLTAAGVKAVSERLFQFAIEAPMLVEDFLTLRCEMSEKLRGKMAGLPQEQAKHVRREMLEAFREYSGERGVSFPAEVLIVSGANRNPA